MKRMALFVVLLALGTVSWAASPWSGVWLLRDTATKFRLTMTLEEVGAGWKITYRIPVPDGQGSATASIMTIVTALDGKEVPNLVDGKPTGQTMEIRKIDDSHVSTVMKFQGKQTGTSRSEISRDGRVIKSENDYSAPGAGGAAGKQVQYWDKQ